MSDTTTSPEVAALIRIADRLAYYSQDASERLEIAQEDNDRQARELRETRQHRDQLETRRKFDVRIANLEHDLRLAQDQRDGARFAAKNAADDLADMLALICNLGLNAEDAEATLAKRCPWANESARTLAAGIVQSLRHHREDKDKLARSLGSWADGPPEKPGHYLLELENGNVCGSHRTDASSPAGIKRHCPWPIALPF